MRHKKPHGRKALTGKQIAFVNAFLGDAKENATEAAKLAGYSGTRRTLQNVGSVNLSNPIIASEITRRRKVLAERSAWTAEDRKRTLRDIAEAENTKPRDRIAAISEGNKMDGLHLTRHEVGISVEGKSRDELIDGAIEEFVKDEPARTRLLDRMRQEGFID